MRQGYIYVAAIGRTGLVKVGYSILPKQRARELGSCLVQRVRVIGQFPASVEAERAFHKRFRSHRTVYRGYGEIYQREALKQPKVAA